MKHLFSKPVLYIIFALMMIGGILRIYNLNWGAPFYFHPDERNIASSISQLVFPTQFNPHFFAYGSLPIYLVFFTGLAENIFKQNNVAFTDAIFLSRVFSFLLSLMLIPSLFYISKHITKSTIAGILAAILTTGSTGLIQFAHFGTFEMWLTFLGLWLFYFCFKLTEKYKLIYIVFSAAVAGLLFAIKVSSLVLLPLPILALSLSIIKTKRPSGELIKTMLASSLVYIFIVCLVYVATNPFVFLDTKDFLDSMHYETSVATGVLPVFYTGEFFTATPVTFQLFHVFPFLLNPFVTVVGFFSVFLFLYICIKTRNASFIFLLLFFVLLFFSQAFLFVKWTRYMVPTIPFIYLMLVVCFSYFTNKYKNFRGPLYIVAVCILAVNLFYGIIFTEVAYGQTDIRRQAVAWANSHIPSSANIVSEVYDLGIVPFNSSYPNIKLFNFYDLDNNNPQLKTELYSLLTKTDYIILPSQRILKPRLLDKENFPVGNSVYNQLFNGQLGFNLVYESPCDRLCKIVYMQNPVFSLEETVTVFDRPILFIFKKQI